MNSIRTFFLIQSVFFAISFVVHVIEGTDQWFSRMCLSIACIGVYGVLRELRNIRENRKDD